MTLMPKKRPNREWWLLAVLFGALPIVLILLRAVLDAVRR
jgi:hypothetical protein